MHSAHEINKRAKVLRPTRHNRGHFGDILPSQKLTPLKILMFIIIHSIVYYTSINHQTLSK